MLLRQHRQNKNAPFFGTFLFYRVAEPGFAPGATGYEPVEILLLHSAIHSIIHQISIKSKYTFLNFINMWIIIYKSELSYGTIYNTMAKFKEKLEALKLRRKGWSIGSIAEHLEVGKGSVSTWCKDLKLTKSQKDFLKQKMIKAGHKGRMIGAEMNRKKKENTIAFYQKSGKKDIGKLSQRDIFVIGVALYWAEGSRKNSSLSFVNSDPDMIKLMYRWFQEVMSVKKEEFMPCVFINEMHRPRITKVMNFWSSLLNLPKRQFSNPVFLKMKQKKVYENYDSYFGVLALRVSKGTNLKYKILGLIDALKR